LLLLLLLLLVVLPPLHLLLLVCGCCPARPPHVLLHFQHMYCCTDTHVLLSRQIPKNTAALLKMLLSGKVVTNQYVLGAAAIFGFMHRLFAQVLTP
jgi:hypothetical protein